MDITLERDVSIDMYYISMDITLEFKAITIGLARVLLLLLLKPIYKLIKTDNVLKSIRNKRHPD